MILHERNTTTRHLILPNPESRRKRSPAAWPRFEVLLVNRTGPSKLGVGCDGIGWQRFGVGDSRTVLLHTRILENQNRDCCNPTKWRSRSFRFPVCKIMYPRWPAPAQQGRHLKFHEAASYQRDHRTETVSFRNFGNSTNRQQGKPGCATDM